MLRNLVIRFWVAIKSWVFLSGLFWKTLLWGLAASAVAKFLVNATIKPLSQNLSLKAAEGQIFPFPPGRFAITHAEHWHDGWPDYTDGLVGRIAATLGSFVERFIDYDNVELIIWSRLMGLILWSMTSHTFNQTKEDMTFDYIAVGLFLAGGISNQAEVALLGHATDFLFLRTSDTGFVVANFADVMMLAGLILFFVWSPLSRLYKQYERAEKTEP